MEITKFLDAFTKLDDIEKIGTLYLIGATNEDMSDKDKDGADMVILASELFNKLDDIRKTNLMHLLEVANGTEVTTEYADKDPEWENMFDLSKEEAN